MPLLNTKYASHANSKANHLIISHTDSDLIAVLAFNSSLEQYGKSFRFVVQHYNHDPTLTAHIFLQFLLLDYSSCRSAFAPLIYMKTFQEQFYRMNALLSIHQQLTSCSAVLLMWTTDGSLLSGEKRHLALLRQHKVNNFTLCTMSLT